MTFVEFLLKRGDSFPFFVTLVDILAPDQPLIFANKYFKDFTGYGDAEIIGRNCRFLQNDKGDGTSRMLIRDAVSNRDPLCIDILNFKKNGERFYNRLILIPFREEENHYFLGLQNEVAEDVFGKFPERSRDVIMDKVVNPLTVLMYSDITSVDAFERNFSGSIERIRNFIHAK